MKTTIWNPFRGCHKISTGCKNCYIALGDLKKGKDFDTIEKTPCMIVFFERIKKEIMSFPQVRLFRPHFPVIFY